MVLKPSTLRPGLLVSLKTALTGNVRYVKTDIAHVVKDATDKLIWETQRYIEDKAEHERAVKARSKARAYVTGVCAKSAFGLLCPESQSDQLEIALADARRIADEFNATAQITRIDVFAMIGRVEQNDVEAVRAINSEVRDLLAEMSAGLENFQVDRIRDAANKARDVKQMLTPAAQTKVQEAIDAARQAARDIKSRIKKAGEEAVLEIDRQAIETIAKASVGFVDLEDADTIAAPTQEGAAVDLDVVNYIRNEVEPELKAAAFDL